MARPLVAVVGKPNVGKSTFFNKVSGDKKSIVFDTPGVTRDRIYADVEWCGYKFTMVDTGGISLGENDVISRHIRKQAQLAMEISDVILFFVDGKTGVTLEDYDVVDLLRRTNKTVLLVVNKIDNFPAEDLSDFYSLGIGEPIPISSEHMKGVGDLLDEVVKNFDEAAKEEDDDDVIKIAVVGKPNAGKSSLVNKLLGFERTIVSNIAGTTRDAIDTPFEVDGQKYLIIDTAGIRRKRSVEDNVEYYSVLRSLASIRRADVCLIVLDAAEELSEQDVKIAGYVHEQGKPSIVVVNKWDLIEKDTFTVEKYNKKLKCDLAFMDYFKSLTISAKTGQRVNKLLDMVNYVYQKSTLRVTTGVLNDVITDATLTVEPPAKKGRRLKILYATQPTVQPPTFVIFVNNAELMHFSYKRYLENCLRRAFGFDGTPIKVIIRSKDEKEA
ncbi:MAG: ribosome biogenesis GTPase Der [Clostridiales bacterium]|nr:ribosome biogenesis GTPase Der [Clostridiales bacterium]